jgi:C_GCAxxG_C_C family probable redox protein
MSEGKLAQELYQSGYSCAEAAWLAMAKDLSDKEKNFGLKLSGGFGGGVGCGSVCGALAGAVLGLGAFLGREQGEPRPDQLRRSPNSWQSHSLRNSAPLIAAASSP